MSGPRIHGRLVAKTLSLVSPDHYTWVLPEIFIPSIFHVENLYLADPFPCIHKSRNVKVENQVQEKRRRQIWQRC